MAWNRLSHSMEAHLVRKRRAAAKYKKTDGDKWIINICHKYGGVRHIDLISCNPVCLREFESKEAAVAFEEDCYQEAKRLKAEGKAWSHYRYIPRKQLGFHMKPLEESVKSRENSKEATLKIRCEAQKGFHLFCVVRNTVSELRTSMPTATAFSLLHSNYDEVGEREKSEWVMALQYMYNNTKTPIYSIKAERDPAVQTYHSLCQVAITLYNSHYFWIVVLIHQMHQCKDDVFHEATFGIDARQREDAKMDFG